MPDTAPTGGEQAELKRAHKSGFARIHVMAPAADRDLIRALARRLTEAGPDADAVRATVQTAIKAPTPATGGILAALRRSPLVAADLDLTCENHRARPPINATQAAARSAATAPSGVCRRP